MRLFETFWIAPKGPPFICFDILQRNGCRKIAKSPPFTFFGTVTLFKNLIKNFFREIFSCPQRGPLRFFFHFLQPAGVSQSPKGPPFSILSLRYCADFGRSRLVFHIYDFGLVFELHLRFNEFICLGDIFGTCSSERVEI